MTHHNSFCRLSAFLLAFLLLFMTGVPVSAANASAVDMRLEAVEGTVTLQNTSGRSISVREGMKLYNGYTVKTDKESYAYLSLDESKAVKLDANSSLEVRKQGKKLELLLKSGQLLFDVKKPLNIGETMNIRTSTMVTGIRGTVGIVTARANSSAVYILEGSTVVSLPNGSTSVEVTAGISGYSTPTAITLGELTASMIPGFAAVELAADSVLTSRIEAATGWDLTPVIAGSSELLKQDELRAVQNQAKPMPVKQLYSVANLELSKVEIMNYLVLAPSPSEQSPTGTLTLDLSLTDDVGAPITADVNKTYTFVLTSAEGGSQNIDITIPTGASTGAVTLTGIEAGTYSLTPPTVGSDTVTQGNVTFSLDSFTPNATEILISAETPDAAASATAIYESTAYTLTTNANAAELQTYLDSYETVILSVEDTATTDAAVTIANGETVTVPTGKKLVIAEALQTNDGFMVSSVLTIDGTLANNGTLEILGEASFDNTGNGEVENYGTITVGGNGRFTNSGTITNYSGSHMTSNAFAVANIGTMIFEANSETTVFDLSNEGTMEISGLFTINYALTNLNTGTITVKNGGEIVNNGSSTESDVAYSSTGIIQMKSTITIEAGGTLTNNGDVVNYDTIVNNGTIVNSYRIYNSDAATFTNNSTYTVDGGTFTNDNGTLDGTNPIQP